MLIGEDKLFTIIIFILPPDSPPTILQLVANGMPKSSVEDNISILEDPTFASVLATVHLNIAESVPLYAIPSTTTPKYWLAGYDIKLRVLPLPIVAESLNEVIVSY
jgi:hypothetical protein